MLTQSVKGLDQHKRLFLILILVVNLVVYFPSFFHIARSEQNLYLYETSDIHGLKDLIVFSYSFARTRLFAAGDDILFRPFLYIFFAVEKWLFGYHFFFWQLTAVILNLCVAWQLLRILNFIFPHYLSYLFVLNFSVIHISQEMVIWHHMTPIVLQMAILLAAFYNLLQFIESKQTKKEYFWKIILYLLIASMFHEFALIVNAVFILVLWTEQYLREGKRKIAPSRELIWLLVPMVIFISLSLWDYWARFGMHTPITSSGDRASDIFKFIPDCLVMLGLALILPWMPGFLNIGIKSMWSARATQYFSELNETLFKDFWNGFAHQLNFILILLIGFIFFVCIVMRAKTTKSLASQREDTAALTALLLSTGYVAMIVASRIVPKGLWYFNINLFYFYPVILFNQIYIYFFVVNTVKVLVYRRWFILLLMISLSLSIVINGYKNFKWNLDLKKYSEVLLSQRPIPGEPYYLFNKLVARSMVYFGKKRYDDALNDLNRAIGIYNDSADVYNSRAIIYTIKGREEEALVDYNKALKINSRMPEAYAGRGEYYLKKGELDLALADFNSSLDVNPAQPKIYNNRGNIYFQKKQFLSAIDDYTKALAYNDSLLEAYYNRGLVYLNLKDYGQAFKDFNHILELDPQNKLAYSQKMLILNSGVLNPEIQNAK